MTSGFIEGIKCRDGIPISIGIDHIIAIEPYIIEIERDGKILEKREKGTRIYTDSSKRCSDIYCIEIQEKYDQIIPMIQNYIDTRMQFLKECGTA